jgi:hypothetical protein
MGQVASTGGARRHGVMGDHADEDGLNTDNAGNDDISVGVWRQ